MAFDWNSSTVASSATNHCAVTGVSRTATSFAFTFKLDRNWGPVETPDATHTNDVRNTFIHNYASQSNAVNELTTWTNVPAGTAVAYLDGVPCATNTVVNGTLSINWFHIYKGALHEQGMTVLDGTRQGRDISTVDAANYSGLTYARNIGSQSSTAWPTNGGAADYISRMAVYEAPLETLADTINAAAQQTNHTLSIVIGTPIFAPFRR